MSKDKYPRMYLRKMEAIVFSILQIFLATRAVLKLWHSDIPKFSVTRLVQTNRVQAKNI